MAVDFVLANCVYLIAELPPRPSLLFESQSQSALWGTEKEYWRVISLWLRNSMLGEALSPEAYEGSAAYYWSDAEWLKGLFDLVVAVHSRSGNPSVRDFSSPVLLWYQCVWVRAQREAEIRGLTGLPAMIAPKREIYKGATRICTSLEKLRWEPGYEYWDINKFPDVAILLEAQALAKEDAGFKYHGLRPFLQKWRRMAKYVKENPDLQYNCVKSNGTIYHTKQNYKLPRSL